jgi:CDP-paratose 2-epimerase
MKKYLITGGCGFVGSNVAARLLDDAEQVFVFDNLSRHGTDANLQWLRGMGLKDFVKGDTSHSQELEAVLESYRPDVIFHLAGQVAMTTSMNDPRLDFNTNVLGSFNLLEGVRKFCPEASIVYSSSNKVYGELNHVELVEGEKRYSAPAFPHGIDESAPLEFQTPYGCSKGAADQYMLDFARVYGLNTAVFRHSTIYGGRQYATFDQGWVGWFCQKALELQRDPHRNPFTISGNGKQVRDLLYVDDAVECYLAAARHMDRARGHAFNIGGGMSNSCSLLELFEILEQSTGVNMNYEQLNWRHSDQRLFVADNRKATDLIGWVPNVSREEGVAKMLHWAKSLMI